MPPFDTCGASRNDPQDPNWACQSFPQACDLAPEESNRTPTVLACTHCVAPDCSLHPSVRQALSGNHFSTHQCPQQLCIPFVASTWHCFQPVPSASVLRPELIQQICRGLLPCRRNPWQSETCADQLEDTLGFQPISTNPAIWIAVCSGTSFHVFHSLRPKAVRILQHTFASRLAFTSHL